MNRIHPFIAVFGVGFVIMIGFGAMYASDNGGSATLFLAGIAKQCLFAAGAIGFGVLIRRLAKAVFHAR